MIVYLLIEYSPETQGPVVIGAFGDRMAAEREIAANGSIHGHQVIQLNVGEVCRHDIRLSKVRARA